MKKQPLTGKQHLQEDEYAFPYHYLDLISQEHRLIQSITFRNRLFLVRDLLKPFVGQSILDAGCGDGRLCYELSTCNVNISGADFSERALLFAKAFSPDANFFLCDFTTKIPGTYDAIVLMEVLEHFVPEKIPLILENIAKALKPQGKLIVTVPSMNRPLSAKHYQHFSKETLIRTLEHYFHVREVRGLMRKGGALQMFNILKRLGLLLFPVRKIVPMSNRYYEFLDRYYRQKVFLCPPSSGKGLLAICTKKNLKKKIY